MTEDRPESDEIVSELIKRAEEYAEESEREPEDVDWDSVGEDTDDDHHLYDWKER
jgi:hypothetical protein